MNNRGKVEGIKSKVRLQKEGREEKKGSMPIRRKAGKQRQICKKI